MQTVDVFELPFPRASIGNTFGIKGPFYGPQGHRGLDFVQPLGAKVRAVAHGQVVFSDYSSGLGNVIVVKHLLKRKLLGKNQYAYSGYCHLSARFVKVGVKILRDQVIGDVGNTGRLSAGNHLHLTISGPNGDANSVFWGDVQDPLAFIDGHDGGK